MHYPKFINKYTHISYERIFTKLHLNGSYDVAYDSQEYTDMLQDFVNNSNVNTIIALGCTAWNNINHLQIPENKTFIGYDVVPDIIAANNAEFSKDNVHFYYIENFQDFVNFNPKGDLLIVKDFLQYWPNKEITYFNRKILPKFKYTLIINNILASSQTINEETRIGEARTIDLRKKPFNIQKARPVLRYDLPQTKVHKQVLLYERQFG